MSDDRITHATSHTTSKDVDINWERGGTVSEQRAPQQLLELERITRHANELECVLGEIKGLFHPFDVQVDFIGLPGIVKQIYKIVAAASLPESQPKPEISLAVYQHDWIPGFAAFHEDGSIQEGAQAHVVLNLGSLLCAVANGDLPQCDLPYMIAETLMHETIHALESWAKVEFSEERVEKLLNEYHAKYGEGKTHWVADSTRDQVSDDELNGIAKGLEDVTEGRVKPFSQIERELAQGSGTVSPAQQNNSERSVATYPADKSVEYSPSSLPESQPSPSGDLQNLLCNVAQILDVVKREWGESWSAWDQEQRDAISKHLRSHDAKVSGQAERLRPALEQAYVILQALNLSVKWELSHGIKTAITDCCERIRAALQESPDDK